MSGLVPAQTGSTTTTTSQTPPVFQGLIPQLTAAGESVNTDPFGSPFFAAATPQERQGLADQAAFLQGIGPGFGQGAINLGQQTLAGNFLDLNTAPGGAGVLEGIKTAGNDQFQQALNRLNLGATPGTQGGARAGIEQAQLLGESQRSTQDIISQTLLSNFARERGLQQVAPDLLAKGFQLGQAPGAALTNLGEQSRGLNQIDINNQLAAREDERTSPFAGLMQVLQGLSGIPFGQNVTAQTSTPVNQQLEWLKIILGLGAGGLGTLSGLGGVSGIADLFSFTPTQPAMIT